MAAEGGESLPIFGLVDAIRGGTGNGGTGCFQSASQVKRGLASELHYHRHRLLGFADLENVFDR